MEPVRVLLEDTSAGAPLPAALHDLYGGDLNLADELLYANVVASVDGVATLRGPGGPRLSVRGRCDADRLIAALLRALADCVVIGAGTLRAYPRHRWTPSHIARDDSAAYAALDRPDPRLVVVTARGDLDPRARALQDEALILTTDAGAQLLAARLSGCCRVRSLGPDVPSAAAILQAIRSEGYRRVLTEGGPTLLASLVAEGVVDELFLTLSPVLAGRRSGDGRLGVMEGVHLLPDDGRWARLRSVRSAGSHLFLRYGLGPANRPAPA